MTEDDAYSEVANQQLDALERGPDIELYNAVLDVCDLAFRLSSQAQSRSTAIATQEGIRLRLPVTGHQPYKVFWSSQDTASKPCFLTRSQAPSTPSRTPERGRAHLPDQADGAKLVSSTRPRSGVNGEGVKGKGKGKGKGQRRYGCST